MSASCQQGKATLWEFVGGKVEPGETKEQALIRECKEELDITLEVGDIFTEAIHEYPDITISLLYLTLKSQKVCRSLSSIMI